ncbi:MAG TPA: hypothetical protein VHE30_05555 [Polyangiaceae bacterium]|nr:hypothetical protein [Polyangiaceae bacterium]
MGRPVAAWLVSLIRLLGRENPDLLRSPKLVDDRDEAFVVLATTV